MKSDIKIYNIKSFARKNVSGGLDLEKSPHQLQRTVIYLVLSCVQYGRTYPVCLLHGLNSGRQRASVPNSREGL